jgi:hypothetical protein
MAERNVDIGLILKRNRHDSSLRSVRHRDFPEGEAALPCDREVVCVRSTTRRSAFRVSV